MNGFLSKSRSKGRAARRPPIVYHTEAKPTVEPVRQGPTSTGAQAPAKFGNKDQPPPAAQFGNRYQPPPVAPTKDAANEEPVVLPNDEVILVAQYR